MQLLKNLPCGDIFKETNVPLEYLREISRSSLPLTVEEEAKIDKLRVLRAADLVSVMLPHPHSGTNYARVLFITQKGREFLLTKCNP